MKHTDVSTLINNAYKQATGAEDILSEDLSNVVDAGNTIFNTTDKEIFTNALMDQVGRFAIDSKKYEGKFYGLLRDAFDFGILCKVTQTKLPEANVNETWSGLEDLVSYDQQIFYQPKNIEAKFYQKQISFEIPISIVDRQLKEAFTGPEQLSAYVGMLITGVESAVNLALTNLCRRTLNNHIGEVINGGGANLINLLDGFLTLFPGSPVTAATAIYDKDFLRYAAFVIGQTYDRIKDIGSLYNINGADTWANEINAVYLSDFKRGMEVYLYDANGQLKDGNLKLVEGETTPYWQTQGDDGYALADIASINIKTSENNSVDTKTDGMYILACMFDRDSCSVSKLHRYATSSRNNRCEFTTTYNKLDCSLLNDFNKNFVVFVVKDAE